MISKLNEHAARVRFEITSMTLDRNCTTKGSITTLHPLLHPLWNIAQIQDLVSSNILLKQYWAGLKSNSTIFLGEKEQFWKQKLQNLPHNTLCLTFSCNLIDYFKQASKSDRLFCFQCSLLIGWEKDAI